MSDVSQGLCFEESIEACGRDVMGGSKLAPLRAELLRAMGRPLAPTSLLPRALPAFAFRFRVPLAPDSIGRRIHTKAALWETVKLEDRKESLEAPAYEYAL